MESSRDDNMEQMAGSAGDLEVMALAKPINKVLSFLKIRTSQDPFVFGTLGVLRPLT